MDHAESGALAAIEELHALQRFFEGWFLARLEPQASAQLGLALAEELPWSLRAVRA